MTQEVQLFNATVRENLTFFDVTIPDGAILATLTNLGLGDWLARLPAGLDTQLSGGEGLSAGEAQLLAFARAFLANPRVVILDEASSRLDPATERLVEAATARLLQGRTAIVIAHRLNTLRKADFILVLERGRVAEYGPREVLASDTETRFHELLRAGLAEVGESAMRQANAQRQSTPQLPPTWRVWWRLARFAPGLVAGSLTLQMGRMIIQFAPALVIRELFDALTIAGRLTPGLWALIALLVGVALARLVILVNAIWLEATVNHHCSALVRTNLIERLYQRPGALPLPYPTGDVLGRLTTDAWTIASSMSFVLLEALGMVVTLAVVVLMASINLPLTVVALLPLIGAAIIANRFGTRVQRYGRASRDASGQVSAFLRELFGGVQAVQVANAEARVVRHFGRLNDSRQRAALQEQLFQGLVMTSLLENVAHISTGLVLLLAGRAMLAGSFTIGDFALFSYCLPILSDFILHFGLMLTSYKQAGVAIERTSALLHGDAAGLTTRRETHICGRSSPRALQWRRQWRNAC